ncbi:MAG: pyruvate kinase, partial [Phycisphaerae bacterium]
MPDGFTAPVLDKLIAALDRIRLDALAVERTFAAELERVNPACLPSARNLLHYLELRHQDLRDLQRELAGLGLSSLGRSEAHVLASLDAVLAAMHRIAGRPLPRTEAERPPVDLHEGPALLERHTDALLGPRPRSRRPRIMVTMPTEAAGNPHLVRRMIEAGMDVCRINCAHDTPIEWQRMIRHVRQAAQELERPCRVMMDLAGPKLRTGRIAATGRVLRCRPTRDMRGEIIRPARVWLTPAEKPQAPDVEADAVVPVTNGLLRHVQPGDRLHVRDCRGKRREMRVIAQVGESCWAEVPETTYLEAQMGIRLDRPGKSSIGGCIGDLPLVEEPILLAVGDTLVLTRDCTPGGNARRSADGSVLRPAVIPCTLPEVFERVRPGERIFLDDGQIAGVVKRADAASMAVEITVARPGGAKLRSDRGINLPDSDLDLSGLTPKDRLDLAFAAAHADMVGLSFIRRPADIDRAAAELADRGGAGLGLVFKIETRQAFERLPRLLLTGLRYPPVGVIVARGDLGVELGFERLAEVQEQILWLCEAAHVPVIWATQVLETLAKTGSPSRAEVTDAAMSGRAECVMLNKGPHIVEAVLFL